MTTPFKNRLRVRIAGGLERRTPGDLAQRRHRRVQHGSRVLPRGPVDGRRIGKRERHAPGRDCATSWPRSATAKPSHCKASGRRLRSTPRPWPGTSAHTRWLPALSCSSRSRATSSSQSWEPAGHSDISGIAERCSSLKAVDAQIEFSKDDAQGRPSALTLHQNGAATAAPRLGDAEAKRSPMPRLRSRSDSRIKRRRRGARPRCAACWESCGRAHRTTRS